MITKEFINNYKKLVAVFASSDKSFNRFGSTMHRYKLNKVANFKQVEYIETRTYTKLPIDYVAYLTNIANGGFSKYYGLYEINKAILTKFNYNGKSYIEIEHQGCTFYTLLNLNTGTISYFYDVDDIEDTNLTFELYLLSPFFDDKLFIEKLKNIDKDIYDFLMNYHKTYENIRTKTYYEQLTNF